LTNIRFDPALPINAKRAQIREALEACPVVIVCGETGSGKTTQLPKMLLEMGRGSAGLIGHTQPRRVAARSVAARIAEELGEELGGLVGYKVRFHDVLGRRSLIKLMTDGILLAETQGDRLLSQYDTLIIDEAHERSLNIDFLLGYLKRLIAEGRRPDLKLLITSATIDAERFAAHFGGAPVIEVSGRLYPVELRYRPVGGDKEDTTREEEEAALADAVDELFRSGEGDVLVFLPGEREIRDLAEVLSRRLSPKAGEREILPLFGRLSAAEQDRVFHPGTARRVVLATNVAETSLTVPRIRYVVDTGLARVKRYSYRNKVEQLLVEPISQAAAQQRAGRCGRVANGICIRLWSEEEHNARNAYTDPEILRSSLAAVILRAASLDLGSVEAFPFLDPPAPRAVADGYGLLTELGAVDESRALTEVGAELARLPLDPRIGRMLIAAREEGCIDQLLVIAAALSVQDPRERPADRAGSADERHARFADERSDFLAFLKLWSFYERAQADLSNRKLVQACRDHFLSVGRLREWRDIHAQLRRTVTDLGWPASRVDPARPEGYRSIHRALLAGLLGNVGFRDESEGSYAGARGIRFWVHPGSWTRKPGRWIVAAELVETSRLYARTVASVDPRWIEDLGAHLLKRSREHPHWEKSRAQVVASEGGTLYGMPVYAARRVHYGPLDPALSRDIFIRAALVEGELETRAPFYSHNRRLVEEIERLEHKSRRPDILVDDELIRAFYDARIPEGIHNGADFEKWRRDAEREDPKRLFLRRDDLMRHVAAGITTDNFPARFRVGPNKLALEYHFEPGSPRDGVTLVVPAALLNQVPAARCEWLVPGMLKEKIRVLGKSLPQRLRHKLGSLDEFAEAFVAAEFASDTPLTEALTRHIRVRYGLALPIDALRPESIPPHLQMNFRVLADDGRTLAQSRALAELKRDWGRQTEAALEREASEPDELHTSWTFGDLKEVMELKAGGRTLIGYPAVVDAGDGVALKVLDSPEKARELHRQGVRRLLAIAYRDRIREIEKGLTRDARLAPMKEDIVAAALERCFLADALPTRQADFARRLTEGRSRFNLIAQEIQRLAQQVLQLHAELQKRIAAARAFPAATEDLRQQLERLLPAHWLARTPWQRLQHVPRYLSAALLRLEKLRADPSRDQRLAAEMAPLQSAFLRERAVRLRAGTPSAELEQFAWLLEELRVALFAQELKTPVPVSVRRLTKLWQGLRR
jgi:ATP-dependent helicase HrpA